MQRPYEWQHRTVGLAKYVIKVLVACVGEKCAVTLVGFLRVCGTSHRLVVGGGCGGLQLLGMSGLPSPTKIDKSKDG